MPSCKLRFNLASYWQIGSGAGEGAIADSVALRDSCGLPVIPGRAIKGLVRDAMELLSGAGHIPADRVVRWFGSALPGFSQADDADQRLEEGRFKTQEAELWFGSAQLPSRWRQWVRSGTDHEEVLNSLFNYVASTAIDAQGVARNHTLRVSEVVVPMTLESEVEGPADNGWIADLRQALPLVRCLGKRRSRGYGRVEVTLEEKR